MYKRLYVFLFAGALCLTLPLAAMAEDSGSSQPPPPPSDQGAPPPGDQQNPPPPPGDQGTPPPGQPQNPPPNQPQNPPPPGEPQNPPPGGQQPYQGLQPIQDGQNTPPPGTPGQNPNPYNPGQNNPPPTCNVNGVEQPGPCQGGQGGQGGQMGPQNGPQNGGQGMSDEERQKMDEEREKKEAEMRAKQFTQMKRDMKSFIKNIKSMQTRIDKLVKQKLAVPDEIKSQVAEWKKAGDEVMAATDPDEVQDQLDALRDAGNEMGDIMRRLDMLARLPSMLKQADREIKRLETAYANAVKKTTRAKFDASSILTKWRSTLDEMKAALAPIKAGEYGEDDDPMQTLGDEIFNRMEEASQYQRTIDMLLNAKSQMKRVATALKRYKTTIARLEKKKEDMTEAKELLAEMQAKYDEVSKVVAGGLDPDEVEAALEDMDMYIDLQDQIEDLLHLSAPTVFEKQMQAPPPGGSLKMSVTSAQKILASIQALRGEIAKLKRPVPMTMLAKFGLLDESGLTRLIGGAKSQAVAFTDVSNLSSEVKGTILATIESLGY